MSVTVGALAAGLAERFPIARAEPWDRNGLLAGDPERIVTGVRLALDPTVEVIQRAAAAGENVVVTHHPVSLSMPSAVLAQSPESAVLFAALDARIALMNAHTTLDRDPVAQRRLPELLGLTPIGPLEASLQPMCVVTTYVPSSDTDAVVDAMAAAGAGRIGDYRGCSFVGRGEGRFTVPSTGDPAIGRPGSTERSAESRVEMVCPAAIAPRIVAAAAAAHPYEEPLVTVTEAQIGRNAAALGMLCAAQEGTTLASLADSCARAFGTVPRVWGAAEAPVSCVATTTGSGGSLIGTARGEGADVLVLGEVRYHDAMAAGPLAIIELGHDVSEWPFVDVLADAVRAIPGIESMRLTQERPAYGWWSPDRHTDEER